MALNNLHRLICHKTQQNKPTKPKATTADKPDFTTGRDKSEDIGERRDTKTISGHGQAI